MPRRSTGQWVVRLVLAGLALAMGYVAVTRSLAQAVRVPTVTRAHALAPGNGRIAAILSERLSAPDVSASVRKRSDELAREALRREPTAVAAVATLGMNAQLRGDTPRAERLFAYSQRISRRDLRTQIWAIETAVSRNDIPGALKHYDTALRTSRAAAGILFPILTSAMSDPAIRAPLIRTLATRPVWTQAFLDHVAANSNDARPGAILFQSLRRAGIKPSPADDTLLITSLVADRYFGQAWAYYASVRPGADRRQARDPRFAANLERPSPFDWNPIEGPGISSSIQRGDRDAGVLDFVATPGAGGMLLMQLQMLPPGRYVLTGRSANLDQPEAARPYWQLTCEGGREIGRVVMPNSNQQGGAFAGQFVVPAGCPVQVLSLTARPSDSISGVSGQIEQVSLRPVR